MWDRTGHLRAKSQNIALNFVFESEAVLSVADLPNLAQSNNYLIPFEEMNRSGNGSFGI